MSAKQAKLLLLGVIIARSTAFLFSKITLQTMELYNILGVRFLIAFLLLALLFHKKILSSTRSDILHGGIIGFTFFLVMVFEMFALRITDSSTVSFLENSSIIMVPILESIWQRRKPAHSVILCGLIIFIGVGILATRNGGSIGGGEILCLASAFMYAISMMLTGRFATKNDTLLLGIYQIGFMGLFSLIASLFTEATRLPSGATEWSCLAILIVICTCFGFTLQPMAQKYVSTEETAQFCAVSPLSSALLSCVFLNESFGVHGLIGAALILFGLILHGILEQQQTHKLLCADKN